MAFALETHLWCHKNAVRLYVLFTHLYTVVGGYFATSYIKRMCPWYSSRASGSWSSLYNRIPLSLSVATYKEKKKRITKIEKSSQSEQWSFADEGRATKQTGAHDKRSVSLQYTLWHAHWVTEGPQACPLTLSLVEGIKWNGCKESHDRKQLTFIEKQYDGRTRKKKEQLMGYGVWKPLNTSVETKWTAYFHSLKAYWRLMCTCPTSIWFPSVDISQEGQIISNV